MKHYTTKDIIIKADKISAEVYNLKEGKEVLENQVENCDVEKVKTEPEYVEDEEFKKAFRNLEKIGRSSDIRWGFVRWKTI